MYLRRTLCDVLEDMRACFKTYNFAPMISLIEEVQVMANRMEEKIGMIHDYEALRKEIKILKKECKKIKSEES